MAVSPLELRPRGATALLDAGVRLCLHSSGIWLLVLPGVLAVIAALQSIQQAVEHGAYVSASLWLTTAWALRALGQGAASHHVRGLLLDEHPPTLLASMGAALRRAPSLLFVATWRPLARWSLALVTLGAGLAFGASASVAYAVAMQRRGPLMKLGAEANRMLGPNRNKALVTQLLFGFQWVAAINLHVLVQAALYLARSLLALDVAWLNELASLGNPDWVLLLVSVTFGAFEPLRAAVATLLLLDAGVRRDGVDLLARLEALPRRDRRPTRTRVAQWLLVSLAALSLASAPAAAAGAPLPAGAGNELPAPGATEMASGSGGTRTIGASLETSARLEDATGSLPGTIERLSRLGIDCGRADALGEEDVRTLQSLPTSEHAALARWAHSLESKANELGCLETLERIDQGIALAEASGPDPSARTHEEQLERILARPEFERTPPPPEKASNQEDSPSWFSTKLGELWDRFLEWLKQRKAGDDEEPKPPRTREPFLPDSGSAFAQGLSLVLVVGCGLLVLMMIVRVLGRDRLPVGTGLEESSPMAMGVAAQDASALSRTPITWVSLGDGLAAQGQYREAVRHVYLALLAGLHAKGAIHYDPHASNWDHLLDFRGPSGQRALFRELTLRFDFVWYGQDPIAPEAWAVFREQAISLLPAEGVARHA